MRAAASRAKRVARPFPSLALDASPQPLHATRRLTLRRCFDKASSGHGFARKRGATAAAAAAGRPEGFETHFQILRRSFAELSASVHGSEPGAPTWSAPLIVCWNLRGGGADLFGTPGENIQAEKDEEGVVQVSGWAPSMLDTLLEAGKGIAAVSEAAAELACLEAAARIEAAAAAAAAPAAKEGQLPTPAAKPKLSSATLLRVMLDKERYDALRLALEALRSPAAQAQAAALPQRADRPSAEAVLPAGAEMAAVDAGAGEDAGADARWAHALQTAGRKGKGAARRHRV